MDLSFNTSTMFHQSSTHSYRDISVMFIVGYLFIGNTTSTYRICPFWILLNAISGILSSTLSLSFSSRLLQAQQENIPSLTLLILAITVVQTYGLFNGLAQNGLKQPFDSWRENTTLRHFTIFPIYHKKNQNNLTVGNLKFAVTKNIVSFSGFNFSLWWNIRDKFCIFCDYFEIQQHYLFVRHLWPKPR